MISALDRVENIVEKGENAGYQHFFFSHNIFIRHHPQGLYRWALCGKEFTFTKRQIFRLVQIESFCR